MLPHLLPPMMMMGKPKDNWVANKFFHPSGLVDFATSLDYANGVLVAVTYQGNIIRSADNCATFTTQTITGHRYFNTITGPLGSFFGTQWAAYGSGSQILSSDHGLTWTAKTISPVAPASFTQMTQSYMINNFWLVCGHQGLYSSSVSGDQTPSFGVGSYSHNYEGIAYSNDGNVVLVSNMNGNFYRFQFGNPSINGFWNTGITNAGFATNGNGVMAIVCGGTQIKTTPNISTAFTTYTVPASILQGRFIGRIYWNPWRSEWIIIGNNQGLPNPLCAISPDLLTWTEIAVSSTSSSAIVGALNDVVWDYDANQYCFAANARNAFSDGALILTYKF